MNAEPLESDSALEQNLRFSACTECARINVVHLEDALGIRVELHERGICILRHPGALHGPFPSAIEASMALRNALGQVASPNRNKERPHLTLVN